MIKNGVSIGRWRGHRHDPQPPEHLEIADADTVGWGRRDGRARLRPQIGVEEACDDPRKHPRLRFQGSPNPNPQRSEPEPSTLRIPPLFGSQGCGKTALLNSFVQGNRDVSSFSAPHGEASHVVVESVQVEDGDLGPNEGHEYHIMT